jgi:polyvinyl alcohol dehydrogenase (cytochrome)
VVVKNLSIEGIPMRNSIAGLRTLRALVALGATTLFAGHALADDKAMGNDGFQKACAACHSEPAVPRALPLAQMRKLPPEEIFDTLVSGKMFMQASALSENEKRAVAIYLSELPWGTVPDAKTAEKLTMCEKPAALLADALKQPHWSGWGLDSDNSHFQPAEQAGVKPADLGNLEFKWALGFPAGNSVSTQAAVVGGRIYIGGPSSGIYALDAKTGCAYWKFDTVGEVRGALQVFPRSDGSLMLVATDRKAMVYGLDASSGKLLWQDKADDHVTAMNTGSVAHHDGRIYVPVASLEELAGGLPTYECCTFRGSVVAYELESGKRLWKSYLIPESPKKTVKASNGTQLWGPSGVGVWSQPTVDAKAGALYVTTGDSYSLPAAATSDAIVALDLETGALRWTQQMTADDAFTAGCVAHNADPITKKACGPDVDFGSSAILRSLPNGRRVLLAGQKSGVMHAIDPDAQGAIVWQKRLSPGGVLGGIEWGYAADDQHVYVPISDVWESKSEPGAAGGIYALNIADGSTLWQIPATKPDCLAIPGCNAGQPQAAAMIPGAIFSGSMDGHMRAYDPATGKVIWDVSTLRDYPTVNGVKAKGGSIKGAGVVVAAGWVYFGAGYGLWGMPGNVFMAYGPKGK